MLRRPPLGHVLETAHDMGREHRVLAALAPTDVPVPRPLLLAGPDVIGAPFYVMEHADGEVLRHRDAARRGWTRPRRWRWATSSSTCWPGCTGWTPPRWASATSAGRTGYLARQLRALGAAAGRLAAAATCPSWPGWRAGSAATCREPARHDRARRLPAGQRRGGHRPRARSWRCWTGRWPPSATRWPTWPRWSRGGTGCAGWTARSPRSPATCPATRRAPTCWTGTRAQSGLDLAPLPWYVGFAFFKIAAIFEGIHYRAQQGLTIGEGFEQLGDLVPPLVERRPRGAGLTLGGVLRPGRARPPTARAPGRAPTRRPAAPRSAPCALTAR